MPNTYPYIEASQTDGRQRRPTAILIKPSWTTSASGAALGIANYQHARTAPHEASHFVIDESNIYQCIPIKVVAGHWHCSIKNLIRITVCEDPSVTQYGWENPEHCSLLDNLTDLVAQLTIEYKIRPRLIDGCEYTTWLKRKSRRHGGIFSPMEAAWPSDEFLAQVEQKRKDY